LRFWLNGRVTTDYPPDGRRASADCAEKLSGLTEVAGEDWSRRKNPGAAITLSIYFTMPFDCAQDRPFDNGDFGPPLADTGRKVRKPSDQSAFLIA